MNHAWIVSFLTGASTAEIFGQQIADEVAASQAGRKRSGVGPVIVTNGPKAIVQRQHAARLLQALADQNIAYESANYVADGLILSDYFDFADDAVANAIYFVADDSRVPTLDETRAELAALLEVSV